MPSSLKILGCLAITGALALAPDCASATSRFVVAHGHHAWMRIAKHGGVRHPGGTRLAALVGDRESGLGFYALPRQFQTHRPLRDRRGDAIRYAVASEMGSGYYGLNGGGGYGERHHHALFNPVDGYGTPFFAGYYGSARDDGDDHGPFGEPYKN